jgi:DMSO/TMAO reductase YedYZ heme-binding membrane subunit
MMFPLLITSNTFSVKLLWKYWKVLHKLTYLFFIFSAIHIDLIEWEIWYSLLIVLLIILSVLNYKKVVFWK